MTYTSVQSTMSHLCVGFIVIIIFIFSVLFEDTLRDHLLNLASTPKGVLLLQQTGAMNECIGYMYSRYVRKLQVCKNYKLTRRVLKLSPQLMMLYSIKLAII